SEDDKNNEVAKKVTAFTGRCESDDDSCDEEISFEELAAAYKELCVKSEEICKLSNKQKGIIAQLEAEKKVQLSTIANLESEVTLLSTKLENMTKTVRMLNNGTDKLDEILQVGKGLEMPLV
ncbi:gag-pol polyprotein, partial [Trifolium medium]|nr:gag-pol polyprotein [Trifolium medium]